MREDNIKDPQSESLKLKIFKAALIATAVGIPLLQLNECRVTSDTNWWALIFMAVGIQLVFAAGMGHREENIPGETKTGGYWIHLLVGIFLVSLAMVAFQSKCY